jgi:hypothetical protein
VAWRVVVVLAVMAAVNVWARVGPARAQLITGPVAAAGLVAASGLSREELGLDLSRGAGYAAVAVGSVLIAYGAGLAVPAARRAFRDPRHRKPLRSAVFTALVAVPLATVLFEEVAFRGVLWGLIDRTGGPVWATVVTSLLFGLWHVGSGAELARSRDGGLSLTVVGTVAFTALSGVVFAALRHLGGGLLAPVSLHWAANGLGVLAAAWAWRGELRRAAGR